MKFLPLLFFIGLTVWESCSAQGNCDGTINLLPMYGSVTKCRALQEADQAFIKRVDENFKNDHITAAAYYAKRGWDYFAQHKPDTAMMRFNQAWLLDSLNANVYWGFADLLGLQQKFAASLPFFERAQKLDPLNVRLLLDGSVSYGNMYGQTHEERYLDKGILNLKRAVTIEPKNPALYAQITAFYTYSGRIDSARRYLQITDRLDSSAINPHVRKWLAAH